MSALLKLQSDGFVVTLDNGNLNVTPTKTPLSDTKRILIKKNKFEIINEINATQLQQDIRERNEERAAIMEFDGVLSRADADIEATNANQFEMVKK